jgi:Trypsin
VFWGFGTSSLGVYVNAWKPFDNNSDGTVIEPFHFSTILNVFPHPAFDVATKEYDIAVMTMSNCTSDFEMMEIADMAFMERLKTSDLVKVAGFGQLAIDNEANVDTLQSVEVPYISGIDCKSLYYGDLITGDMICAGFPEGGKDACLGDSGVSILLL